MDERSHPAERREVVTAVFAATGKKIDEDDPIVVAALFQAYTMREVSRQAAEEIRQAGKDVAVAAAEARRAAEEAALVAHRIEANDKRRLASLNDVVKKGLRAAGRRPEPPSTPPHGWRAAVYGVVFGVFMAIGGISVACGFSFEWVADARLGAELRRVFPKLDPAIREQLIRQIEGR